MKTDMEVCPRFEVLEACPCFEMVIIMMKIIVMKLEIYLRDAVLSQNETFNDEAAPTFITLPNLSSLFLIVVSLSHRNLLDISALETFDITADGTPDVIVGRSDGTVQVFSVDDGGEPTQRFKHVSYLSVRFFLVQNMTRIYEWKLSAISDFNEARKTI